MTNRTLVGCALLVASLGCSGGNDPADGGDVDGAVEADGGDVDGAVEADGGDVDGAVEADGAVDAAGTDGAVGDADGGAEAAIHFASEWERTSTGLTTPELLAGEWGVITGANTGPAAEVVDADSGLMGRGDYFRVYNSGTNSRQIQTDEMLPESTTHWGRVYVRSNNTTSRHNHTIAIGSGSEHPIEFAWGFRGEASGSVPFVTASSDFDGNPTGVRWWASDVDNADDEDQLTLDQWYLIEWQIEYLADPTHYSVAVWIHEVDSTGAMTIENKWATANFYESDQPGTGRNLAGAQTTEDYFGISTEGSPDAARRYSFGNEGPLRGTTDSGYMDFASFAISIEGRIRDASVPGT